MATKHLIKENTWWLMNLVLDFTFLKLLKILKNIENITFGHVVYLFFTSTLCTDTWSPILVLFPLREVNSWDGFRGTGLTSSMRKENQNLHIFTLNICITFLSNIIK